MCERDLIASELEENLTRIDFPRPIDETEADSLIRYFVMQMDEKESSQLSVSIHLSQNRHYGDQMKEVTYRDLDEVMMSKGDTKIDGTVRAKIPKLESASFEFRADYNKLNRPSFIGIDFKVTLGYNLWELTCDSVGIMQNMRRYVKSYFDKADKV